MDISLIIVITSGLLNLALLLFCAVLWREKRSSRRHCGLFELILRVGLKGGHFPSDRSCVEFLLTGKLNEETTDFFYCCIAECFARYPYDARVAWLYPIFLSPSFDRYRVYSDKTPCVLVTHLVHAQRDLSTVDDLKGKSPAEESSAEVKVGPSNGQPKSGSAAKDLGDRVEHSKNETGKCN